jgi:formylglycine-generating enzyme required for sulfatase activity
MGAPEGEVCQVSANQVQHQVTLTHAFEMSETEVTFAEFLEVYGEPHPTAGDCPDCPIPLMNWHRAAAVCNAYSGYAGLLPCYECTGIGNDLKCTELRGPYECYGYRLPTEAEWEFAYRAGTQTPTYNGTINNCGSLDSNLDEISWFLYNSAVNNAPAAHPVAGKVPNAWGFYDMSGNMWEWTHDGYITDLSTFTSTDPVVPSPDGARVMKGGSYNCLPGEVKAAHRSGLPAEIAGSNVGVRCARTLD